VKRVVLLSTATVAYLLAAWMVAPGFYDGFTPPQPYNFVCPPPAAPPATGPPQPGHADIKVINGVSDANSAFTKDGQVVIGFLPGAFNASGKTTISVDITPVSPCPNPTGLHFSSNTYLITASAPLVMGSNILFRYSDVVPAPSFIYLAPSPDGPWMSIGGSPSQQFTLNTTTHKLGYFAAGYPADATRPSTTSSQILPIAVAVLIVAVLVAGVPLAVLRRRRAGGSGSDDDEEES
jgi:hypothetical protein